MGGRLLWTIQPVEPELDLGRIFLVPFEIFRRRFHRRVDGRLDVRGYAAVRYPFDLQLSKILNSIINSSQIFRNMLIIIGLTLSIWSGVDIRPAKPVNSSPTSCHSPKLLRKVIRD